MELQCIDIPYYSQNDIFYIIPLGDVHLGNKGCDIERFQNIIDWIKSKSNCYWIGMGDYTDAINMSDKRFDPQTIASKYMNNLSNIVNEQKKDIMKMLDPIKDKCLGLHRGNHEETIRKRYHTDIVYEMCEEWDVAELYDTALTRLRFQMPNMHTNTFDMLSFHGNIGGRKGGNKINRIEDVMGFIDADICLMAHAHKKLTTTVTQLYMGRTAPYELKDRKRVGGVTGGFLRGYQQSATSYVEQCMYPPADLGTLKISIKPYYKDIHISS